MTTNEIILKACEEVMEKGKRIGPTAKKYNINQATLRFNLRKLGYPPQKPGRPVVQSGGVILK